MKSRLAIVLIFALFMAGWLIAPAQGAPAARIDGTAGLKMEKQAPGSGVIAGKGLVYATALANLISNDATGVKVLDLAPPGTQPLKVKRATITLTNNTPGTADGSSLGRTVTVNIGHFPAGSTLSNVKATIDFNKIDDGQPPAGCGATPGSDPWNEEMYFYLTSPAGTRVVLAESAGNGGGSGLGATYSSGEVYNGPYLIVFDDEASLAAGPAPLSGTFRPEQPLSGFDGESPFGDWTLTVGDDSVQDPLCFAAFALELTTPDGPITDLVLDKAGPATVVAGEPIAYTIVVTNNGPSAAPMVEIVDNLPDEVAFLNAAIARSSSGPAGECAYAICQAADVQFGEVLTMTLTGLVDPGAPAGTVLTNRATAFADSDPQPDAGDSHTTTVQAAADLGIHKSVIQDEICLQAYVFYEIEVTNDGPSDAQDVAAIDVLSDGLVYGGGSPECAVSGQNPDGTAGTVTCALDTLAAGESRSFFVGVRLAPQVMDGTWITNTAAVDSSTPDPNATNNTSPGAGFRAVDCSISEADVAIVKEVAPDPAVAGQEMTVILTVTNSGPDYATGVVVVDGLDASSNPSGLAMVDYDAAQSTQGAGPLDGDWYTCSAGVCRRAEPMPPGVVDVIYLTLSVPAEAPAATYQNYAYVLWNSGSALTSTNWDVVAAADLAVTKIALAESATPGGGLLYQITVANDGPSDARGMRITDTLETNVTFVSASPGCSYDAGAHQVICDLGQLAAGSSAHVLLAVTVGQVPGGTVLTNQAMVSSDVTDPAPGNNADSETTDVIQQQEPNVELSITKTAEPATVDAGDLVTYRLTVRNAGPQVATNVEVLELVPAGTTLVSIQAHNPNYAYEFCAPGGVCYLGTVALDTTALITVVLRIDANMVDGPLTNMAAVTADQSDNMPDNNLAHATVTVVGAPPIDLVLVKTGPATVQPGGQAVYSIVVTNQGLTTAGSVNIEDSLPAGIEFVSATIQHASLGPAPCSGPTCQAGDMAAGEAVTMTVTGRVQANLTPGATLNNQATASCSTLEINVDNNTDGHIAVVQRTSIYLPLVTRNAGVVSLPDLVGKIYFAPDKNNWSSGESVLLTVVVTNTGSASAGAFWVDLYINPNPAPVGANLPWNETCTLTPCYGLAWQHAGALDPGESVVLTSTPTSYDVDTSLWVGSFAPGTTDVYLWVDSWNAGSSVGAVQEQNELNNGDARHDLSVSGGGDWPAASPAPVFPPRPSAGVLQP